MERNASLTAILLLAGGVLLLGVAGWGFNYAQQWLSARLWRRCATSARRRVTTVINNDLSFYDEHPSARLSAASPLTPRTLRQQSRWW